MEGRKKKSGKGLERGREGKVGESREEKKRRKRSGSGNREETSQYISP